MTDNDKIYYPEVIDSYVLPETVAPTDNASGGASGQSLIFPSSQVSESFPDKNVSREVISQALNTKSKKILGDFSFGQVGAISIGSYESGVSGDIRITPNGIVARNSSGTTTVSIDGDTGDAVFSGTVTASAIVASSFASASSGARVLIFPDANTGIQIIDNVGSDTFKAVIGGTDVGDIIIGNYAGSNGILWDKSASTFYIKGTMNAGDITGVNITGGVITLSGVGSKFVTGTSGQIVQIESGGAYILFKDGSTTKMKMDWNGTDAYIQSYGEHLALSTDSSSYRVYINSHMDLNSNDIRTIQILNMVSRSSNPSQNNTFFCKNGDPYFRDGSGDSHQLAYV